MQKSDIGIIGMAVMGQNLALNIEDKGFAVSVYNRTKSKTEKFLKERAEKKNIIGTYSIEDFVSSLKKPRKILLMVKAGEAVDFFIESLLPLLEKGDIIIDGGNSYFKDTERRFDKVEKEGIFYLGTGISGGEYGALHGPCIMPGGDERAYSEVEEIFLKCAAKTEDGPCCTYLGPRSAGHFVKMVHNGIEYGIMQILAEAYHLMRCGLKMGFDEIQEVFKKWTSTQLNSYLVEITADILSKKDDLTGKYLLEVILDKAEQKGTGKWTSQSALDLGVPVPTITLAVDARIISSFKSQREILAERFGREKRALAGEEIDRDRFLSKLKDACYFCMFLSYAQGMHLLSAASVEFGYGIDLSEVARIWKGGCIIRAELLDVIKRIYKNDPQLSNLLFSEKLQDIIPVSSLSEHLRDVVIQAKKWEIPTPAMSCCLDYYDSFRTENLPANLIQAQRDFFGAHTYRRKDREGVFHTIW